MEETATIGTGIFLIRAQYRREIEKLKSSSLVFLTQIYISENWLIKSIFLVQISSLFKVSFTD